MNLSRIVRWVHFFTRWINMAKFTSKAKCWGDQVAWCECSGFHGSLAKPKDKNIAKNKTLIHGGFTKPVKNG